ncbi:MAG: hypothetical protein ACTSW1_01245 [Candidatus Hodarchaeales archaeon]
MVEKILFDVIEFKEKEDFGSLLQEYQDAILKQTGGIGQNLDLELLDQLQMESSRSLGLIDSKNNLPVAFSFFRKEDTGKAFVDLVFLSNEYQNTEVFSQLVRNVLETLVKDGVKLVTFSAPSFTDFSFEEPLLSLGFKKSVRHQLRFDVQKFDKLETPLPEQYKIIPWTNKYQHEVAQLIVENYHYFEDLGQYAEYQTVEEWEEKIKYFEKNPSQLIIVEASIMCFDKEKEELVGFIITIPFATVTLVLEMHTKKNNAVISKPLIEKSLNTLRSFGYSQNFFATSYKQVAEQMMNIFPGKCELIAQDPIFYYTYE